MSRVHSTVTLVKAISLIKLENQVQRLMEAHIAPKPYVQMNKITYSCDVYDGPHDTLHCMENLKQSFVDYASSRTDKARGDSEPFDTLADLGSCVDFIPLNLFKKLRIRLLEETENVLGLADGTKSYPVGIIRDVEVYVGKLKILEHFYVTDMEKDPTCPLFVGRGFLAITSVVIDCKKSKIAIGEGITSTNDIGAQPPYYLEKDFKDNRVPGECEIARNAELNPFKDVLVFRKMVEFLGAIPINSKGNMWKSKDIMIII
nr:hypothetical protein [Tanacetum cinerariifolium]